MAAEVEHLPMAPSFNDSTGPAPERNQSRLKLRKVSLGSANKRAQQASAALGVPALNSIPTVPSTPPLLESNSPTSTSKKIAGGSRSVRNSSGSLPRGFFANGRTDSPLRLSYDGGNSTPDSQSSVPSFSMSAASFRKSSSSIPSGRRLSLEGLAGQEVQLTPNDGKGETPESLQYKLLTDLAAVKRERDTLRASNDQLLTEVQKYKLEVESMSQQGHLLQSHFTVAEETKSVTNKVLLELTEQAVSLGHEKAGLMERLQARSWEIDQILRERDGHIEAIRKAEQSEQALRQITAQQIESLRIELDDRTEALHEAARAEEDLIEHAEALEARVSELQAMVDTCWEGKCSRVTALSATIRQLQDEVGRLSSPRGDAERAFLELEADAAMSKEIERLQRTGTLQRSLSDAADQMPSRQRMEELVAENESLKLEREGLLSETGALLVKKEELSTQREALRSSKNALEQTFEVVQEERNRLHEENRGLQSHSNLLTTSIQVLQSEMAELKEAYELLAAERVTLSVANATLQHRERQLAEGAVQSARESVRAFTEQVEALAVDNAALEAASRAAHQERERAKAAVAELTHAKESLQEEVAGLKSQLQQVTARETQEVARLNAEISGLQAREEDLETELEGLNLQLKSSQHARSQKSFQVQDLEGRLVEAQAVAANVKMELMETQTALRITNGEWGSGTLALTAGPSAGASPPALMLCNEGQSGTVEKKADRGMVASILKTAVTVAVSVLATKAVSMCRGSSTKDKAPRGRDAMTASRGPKPHLGR